MAELTVSGPADGVVLVELDRPPDNLWTIELCERFVALLADPPAGAHVLRLRSRGAAFCLGRERAGSTPGELRRESHVLAALQRGLRRSPLISVAEVQGDAAGFGVGVAASCDVAVAAADCRFSFPEVGIGLAPSLVLAWLARAVGEREAFWLTATGDPLSAERAYALGLINEVVASERLSEAVDERVAALRRRSPRVQAEIKQMLRGVGSLGEDEAYEFAVDRLVVGALRRGED